MIVDSVVRIHSLPRYVQWSTMEDNFFSNFESPTFETLTKGEIPMWSTGN